MWAEVLTCFLHTTAPPAICLSLTHLKCLTIVFIVICLLKVIYDFFLQVFSNIWPNFLLTASTVALFTSGHLVGDAQWEWPTLPKPVSSSPRSPVCHSAPPQLPLKMKMRMKRDPKYNTLTIQNFFFFFLHQRLCFKKLMWNKKINTGLL